MAPVGLTYMVDFISEEEETLLVARLEDVSFQDVRMRGMVARRTVVHYGWDDGYDSWRIVPAEPIPPFLLSVRERSAEAAGLAFDHFSQLLVSRYPPGSGVGWHRDAPMFGSVVAGLSLLSPCRIRFRREREGKTETHAQDLAPRSLYLLRGPARSQWHHSIPPVDSLRYSLTFREVLAGHARAR